MKKSTKKTKEKANSADSKKTDAFSEASKKGFRLKKSERMKISNPRNVISKIIVGLILFALAFFFVRTAIWEHYYYDEKEGSPRSGAQTISEREELDETEVTEEQKYEYTVPADHPRYLTIEKLGIVNARVLPMGINSDGELDTPRNIFDVGWYTQSGRPGLGGVLVIDGHNGGINIHGVFKELNKLSPGDLIVVERGDGEKFTYKVYENKAIPLEDADAYMNTAFTSPITGQEALTLISCIGGWNYELDTFDHRQFTRAILVQN